MSQGKLILMLAAILAVITLGTTLLALFTLYDMAFDQRRVDLTQSVQSQARLMESIAVEEQKDHPNSMAKAFDDSLALIKRAFQEYGATGKTGEFAVARRQGKSIIFLLAPPLAEGGRLQSIPFDAQLAEPMRRALSGLSGTIVALDYKGETVLAAFEPVAILNLGVVSKIDMAEIRQPYLIAGALALLLDIFLIGGAAFLFYRISSPLVEKIGEAEERFQAIVESAETGTIVIDQEGGIEIFSAAAERIFGWKSDEAVGRNISFLMPGPEGDRHDGYIQNFMKTGVSKIIGVGRDLEGRRKNGEIFPMRLGIGAFEEAGERRFVGSVTDISERRQAEVEARKKEGQLNAIANANPSLVSHVGKDLIYRFVNEAYAAWYGKSVSEIIGMSVSELHGEEEMKALMPVMERVLAGQEQSFEIELGDLVTDKKSIQGNLIPEFDDAGDACGYFVFTNDVTELKRHQEQLSHIQKLEAVGQLTGGVAHDFNNLLTIIDGNLSLLRDDLIEAGDAAPEEALELLLPALDASRRGAELTQHLLAFARKQALVPGALDMNKVLQDAEVMLKRLLAETIDFKIQLKEGDWLATADPSQLQNAILNLALNSRDALDGKGEIMIKTVEVRLGAEFVASHPGASAGEFVVLSVSDTGKGMTPEVAARAFEPFFTTKEVGEGSGLGLSMIYGFVKQSGGYVDLLSEPGEGTEIRIYLPRSTEQEKPTAEAEKLRGGNDSILVVEDDASVRRVTVRMLKRLGYNVTEAGDGNAALEALDAAGPFDLLLTDLALPGGINGADLVKSVCKRQPGIKILFMSGYDEEAVVGEAQADDFGQYISKPFTPSGLADKVRQAISSQR